MLILPTKTHFEYIDVINQQHLLNCQRFGFAYIDLVGLYDYEDSMQVMRDNLHPNPSLMKFIGKKLGLLDYTIFKDNDAVFSCEYEYYVDSLSKVFIDDYINNEGIEVFNRGNSKFNEDYVVAKNLAFQESYHGFLLLGIGTWNDKLGKVCITNNDVEVIKSFNTDNAFNEIQVGFIIDQHTHIQSSLEDNTETSMNVKRTGNFNGETYITGVLLAKVNQNYQPLGETNDDSIDLSYLIEDMSLIADIVKRETTTLSIMVERLIQNNQFTAALCILEQSWDKDLVVLAKDIAMDLQDTDIVMAHKFMSYALSRKPKSLQLQNKIKRLSMKLQSSLYESSEG